MVLSAPNTVTPHRKFCSKLFVVPEADGGRTDGFSSGYRPQFYIRTTDVTGKMKMITEENGGLKTVALPGDKINMKVELIYPICIEIGTRFAVREGGKTVGAGSVSELYDRN